MGHKADIGLQNLGPQSEVLSLFTLAGQPEHSLAISGLPSIAEPSPGSSDISITVQGQQENGGIKYVGFSPCQIVDQ